MSRKFLTALDLAKNELQNATIQNLASGPSSPVKGQEYFDTTLNQFGVWNGTAWVYLGAGGGTVTSVSVASANGFAGTVANPTTTPAISVSTSITGVLKGNGTAISAATAGTDYQAAITASGLLKGAGAGSVSAATAGTDYSAGTSALTTGIVKSTTSTGALTIAVSGTDYAPATATTSSLKGNGSGGFSAATLNDSGAPTTDFSMASHKLINVLDPTAAQDAATKNYVDTTAQGLAAKASVVATSTTNITLSGAQTIDGISVVATNRVLLTGQTTASQNGIWLANAAAWTRPADFATGSSQLGTYVFVEGGTTNASSGWVLTGTTAVTVDTTSQTWTQFSGAGEIIAGTGLSKAGNTISLTNPVTIALGGTGVASLPTGLLKGAGTGAITAAVSSTDYAPATSGTNVLKGNGSGGFSSAKFAATVGDGTTTAIAVTHNLGTQDVIAQVRDTSTNAVVECDIAQTSTTVTTFTFGVAPALNAYRVVIIG